MCRPVCPGHGGDVSCTHVHGDFPFRPRPPQQRHRPDRPDRPTRARQRAHAAGQGVGRGGDGARVARCGGALRRARPIPISRRRPPTCASSWARSKRLSDAAAERGGAAVSVASGRSVSRAGAALPCRLGAGARPARRGARRGARHRRVGAGAAAAARRARIDPRDVVRSAAAASRSIRRRSPTSSSSGGYERQDPVDEHGEFSLRGGILDVFPGGRSRAGPHRVHRRLGRVDPPLRSRARSDRSRRSISFRSCRSESPSRLTTRRSVATAHRLRLPPRVAAAAHRRRRARRRARADREVDRAGRRRRSKSGSRDKASPGRERRPPAELMLTWEDIEPRPRRGASTLEELAIDATEASPRRSRRRRPRCTSPHSRRRSSAAASPIGSPTCGRRASAAKRCCSSPARTAAPNAPSNCCATTRFAPCPRRRPTSASRVRCSSPKACCRAASGCPTAALQVYAETDIFEEERRRTTTSRKRSLAATFLSDLRDLKVGDYIVHVDNGIGQFVGLKQLSVGHGDIVQEFLELRYHGDDKLFVPGRAARPGPEIHRRRAARRSIGWAARPGRRRRRRSRRPCATWRRSCSSSTPRAAPCRATRLPPTRTGRRSSRARSSGS